MCGTAAQGCGMLGCPCRALRLLTCKSQARWAFPRLVHLLLPSGGACSVVLAMQQVQVQLMHAAAALRGRCHACTEASRARARGEGSLPEQISPARACMPLMHGLTCVGNHPLCNQGGHFTKLVFQEEGGGHKGPTGQGGQQTFKAGQHAILSQLLQGRDITL